MDAIRSGFKSFQHIEKTKTIHWKAVIPQLTDTSAFGKLSTFVPQSFLVQTSIYSSTAFLSCSLFRAISSLASASFFPPSVSVSALASTSTSSLMSDLSSSS